MTFTLPEDVATKFVRQVPARDRSRYVTAAIATKLRESEEALIRACQVANDDPDVLAIEQEWDALSDNVAEPWNDAKTR